MWQISRKDALRVAVAGVVTLAEMEAWAAPCQEFTDAINWAKQTTSTQAFPVEAYFTRHLGLGGAKDDVVLYSFGYVVGNAPLPILSGTLAATFINNNQGKMAPNANWTVYVEIAYISGADGQITYLEKVNGQPVFGATPSVVKAACADDFLMTGVDSGKGVVSVGVSIQPSFTKVVPK
jgi:hypothetical protein